MIGSIYETTDNGRYVRCLSKWLKLYNKTMQRESNAMWYYGEPTDDGSRIVDYFTFRGKDYPLNRFITMNGTWAMPIMWYNEDEKLSFMAGYDSEDYYNPIMIEMDEYCEHVRVYDTPSEIDVKLNSIWRN